MIKTRMTELFGIKHPIMLAGMNWITEPELVAAVCNAGGLGVLATAATTPEESRKCIRKIRELTDKPFGINQILTGPGAKPNIDIAIEEKVPIINYSLGKPWFIEEVHKYGGKVLGTTAIARHAIRAAELGCDAIVITGQEAAAHGANATSMVLIPMVSNLVKVPVIAAGGFYNGRGLAAALVLGADGISMGTRFMLSKESRVHDNFKKLCLQATEQDTLYSDHFDGMDGRALKTKVTEQMVKSGLPIREAFKGAGEIRKLLKLSYWQFLKLSFQMMRAEEGSPLMAQAYQAAGTRRHLKAIMEGDEQEGILFAGECVGPINDLPSIKQIIDGIVAEAEETLEATRKKLGK
jgi:NAD(P)H-dependent flavin oxidoreductase YrpB (nitropropane dioxygenase family)